MHHARSTDRVVTISLAMILAVGGWIASPVRGEGLAGGGGPQANGPCISQAEHAQARSQIEAYKARFGALSGGTAGVPPKFPFYPMAGRLYRDLFTVNFVDLDPSPVILDWDCTDYSYNGHDATDVDLRTFTEQQIGVPIFAALDGVVAATNDGEEDMHTACSGQANYVIVDHGAGRFCYYWHMRKNSVAVSVGQPVKAGHSLGMTASSGCSTGPHLHFATYDDGVLVEPYTGTCNPGDSWWENQTPIDRTMYIRDLNVTNVSLSGWTGPPTDRPRRGSFALGVQPVYFWINLMNMTEDGSWRVRYRRPDLTLALDSGTNFFGNPFYRWSWWWWGNNVNLNVTGTWHLLLDINGVTLATAPIEVVASAGLIANRPPNPVAVSLDPPSPTNDDTIFCLVDSDLILDDPDYDVVRYRYVWTYNGQVLRDVTSAGHSDAIPHHFGSPGSRVQCQVTPSDGMADGPSAAASALLPCPAPCLPFAPVQGPTESDKNRAVTLTVLPVPTATAGPSATTALRVTMLELQNPQPPNAPPFPPPDFSAYEAGASCTDPAGCQRWVGPPGVFLESQDSPLVGNFKAARLQCTAYYHAWGEVGSFHIVGGEVDPSSTYQIENLDVSCAGDEADCILVSPPLLVTTARYGDVAAPFNPPSISTQPDGLDVAALVAKFKGLPGSLSKAQTQLQPNLPDLNADVSALDIVACVEGFKGLAYSQSGPCPCPSLEICNSRPCTSAAQCGGDTCVRICEGGGGNDGMPCISDTHCPGGSCGAGACRDRCGRCTP